MCDCGVSLAKRSPKISRSIYWCLLILTQNVIWSHHVCQVLELLHKTICKLKQFTLALVKKGSNSFGDIRNLTVLFLISSLDILLPSLIENKFMDINPLGCCLQSTNSCKKLFVKLWIKWKIASLILLVSFKYKHYQSETYMTAKSYHKFALKLNI